MAVLVSACHDALSVRLISHTKQVQKLSDNTIIAGEGAKQNRVSVVYEVCI